MFHSGVRGSPKKPRNRGNNLYLDHRHIVTLLRSWTRNVWQMEMQYKKLVSRLVLVELSDNMHM